MPWFSPHALTVPGMLAANAVHRGKQTAVICETREVSWAEFGQGTSKFGNALLDLGLKKGDRVVVLMKNSYEMAEAMMGIIRAGLVAVPLNVSINDAAVVTMARDSRARAIVASGEHVHRVHGMRRELESDNTTRFITADTETEGWLRYSDIRDKASSEIRDITIGPRDECNIIYSSGTTGLPKGIVHDHACRAAWASDMAVALRYHSGARTLLTLGLFSNITWVCMLATFFAGGTIVISRRFDPLDCLETIQTQKITHTGMVPLQYQKLYESEERLRYDLSSLYSSMCCGSPLPLWLKLKLADEWPGQFIELYGLTEGLVTILSPEDLLRKPEAVGLPCPGQTLAIVGDDDAMLEAGESGEIVGECRFLMSGYHDNDAASEEATWMHPSGQRWLRTGDIGRLDDDGFLYLVDRKKDMIVSGGQNIFPADIEAVMLEHDDVADVAVIGAASDRWGETPVAVVVLRNGIAPDELMAWTNSRVGKQQRIAGIIPIAELPRNPNGKVLKRELRDQFADLRFHS